MCIRPLNRKKNSKQLELIFVFLSAKKKTNSKRHILMIPSFRNLARSMAKLYQNALQPAPVVEIAGFTTQQPNIKWLQGDFVHNFGLKYPSKMLREPKKPTYHHKKGNNCISESPDTPIDYILPPLPDEFEDDGLNIAPSERETDDVGKSVPFMITNQMKLDLIDLGYSLEDIRLMTPAAAGFILKGKTKKIK